LLVSGEEDLAVASGRRGPQEVVVLRLDSVVPEHHLHHFEPRRLRLDTDQREFNGLLAAQHRRRRDPSAPSGSDLRDAHTIPRPCDRHQERNPFEVLFVDRRMIDVHGTAIGVAFGCAGENRISDVDTEVTALESRFRPAVVWRKLLKNSMPRRHGAWRHGDGVLVAGA
jgi:hypothetical protein